MTRLCASCRGRDQLDPGYCGRCYDRHRARAPAKCVRVGCERTDLRGLGLCKSHYQALYRRAGRCQQRQDQRLIDRRYWSRYDRRDYDNLRC